MGIMRSLARLAGSVVHDALRPSRRHSTTDQARPATVHPAARPENVREAKQEGTRHRDPIVGVPREPTLKARSRSKFPGPGELPMVYDVDALGLPTFTYSPHDDTHPDPGEVVWTWVPYEEDRSQGKDRPVLVLAEDSGCLVFAQLTSKDHVHGGTRSDRFGNYWMDIGSGAWDSRGRASEVRLDRLLCVHPSQVRREGARLDEARFTQVSTAIRQLHR